MKPHRRSQRLAALLLALTYPAPAQVVEEFYAASGWAYGESPRVAGNLIVWQEYGKNRGHPRLETPDLLQCRDVGLLDSPVVAIAEYPASTAGPLIDGDYVFYGGVRDLPLVARKLGPGCSLGDAVTVREEFGRAVAASRNYVFIETAGPGARPGTRKILAKPLARLADPDAFIEVARIRVNVGIGRTEAASDRYFVWQDDGPPWKLYVMDLSEGIPPETQRVIETRAYNQCMAGGVYLDLAGSYLVFQGAERPELDSPQGIYFADLDAGEDPVPVVLHEDPHVCLDWPSVSREYIVWTKMTAFFEREAFAMRIARGEPTGEAFSLGPGGSWIWIDRNLAVANGVTGFVKGTPVHSAIVVRELDLPGATDVGDADSDGRMAVTDAVVILRHLFVGGPRPRLRLADTSKDRRLDVGDALIILRYLFQSGERP